MPSLFSLNFFTFGVATVFFEGVWPEKWPKYFFTGALLSLFGPPNSFIRAFPSILLPNFTRGGPKGGAGENFHPYKTPWVGVWPFTDVPPGRGGGAPQRGGGGGRFSPGPRFLPPFPQGVGGGGGEGRITSPGGGQFFFRDDFTFR